MIYVYHCKLCDLTQEITKSLSQFDDAEHCDVGHLMQRKISWSGQMKPGDISFKPDYYHAFGKEVTSPLQLKDELSRCRDQGVELVEVGNSHETRETKRQATDKEAAGRAMFQMLKKSRGYSR